MAMGNIVGYWVVNSFVESVINTKIPDLLVVMERTRAGYLARFDAVTGVVSLQRHGQSDLIPSYYISWGSRRGKVGEWAQWWQHGTDN